MRFKAIKLFPQGLYANDEIKDILPDGATTRLHNLDNNPLGRPTRRPGYDKWDDWDSLIAKFPEIGEVYNIYQYIDVGGEKKIFVYSNGFLYLQFLNDAGAKDWLKLNENTQFVKTDGKIAIFSYYDRVFFNDIGQDVWVYDVQYQQFFGYYIEFAGNKINFYNIQSFGLENFSYEIDSTSTDAIGLQLWTDIQANFAPDIPIDINWFEKDIDGNFYILVNGASAETEKHLMKISKALVFQDFIEFDNVGNLRLMQFGLWEDDIYFWALENKITVINRGTFTADSEVTIDWLKFPVDNNGYEISYLSVDAERFYMYSHGVEPTARIPMYFEQAKYKVKDKSGSDNYDDGTKYGNFVEDGFSAVNFYAGDKNDPPIKYRFRKIADNNINVINCNMDWEWRSGVGVDNGWYTKFWRTQKQELGFFSPMDTKWNRDSISAIAGEPHQKDINFVEHDAYYKCEKFLKKTGGFFEEKFTQMKPAIGGGGYPQFDNNTEPVNGYTGLIDGDIRDYLAGDISARAEVLAKTSEDDSGKDFASSIFDSYSLSKYTALVIISRSDNKMYKQDNRVRWIPLTLSADGINNQSFENVFNHIFKYRNEIHFGDRFDDLRHLYSYNILTTACGYIQRADDGVAYPKDFRMISFLENAIALSYHVSTGPDVYETKIFEILKNMDSAEIVNYAYYLYNNIRDWESIDTPFIIHRLNTPLVPKYNVAIDGTSVLKAGYYRYAMVFVFNNDQRTLLGVQTTPVNIPSDDSFAINVFGLELGLFYQTGGDDGDVKLIEIYRQDGADDGAGGITWAELPFLVDSKDKTEIEAGDVEYYDKKQNSDYTPKNFYSETLDARRFKFIDSLVHKNRLVLINKLDEENRNLIMWSQIDNPENIPPGNTRPIQTDEDYLVGGISTRDFLYLFKTSKVHAIFGDTFNGQLLDIDLKAGALNRQVIGELGSIVYFLNQFGIYHIAGNRSDSLTQGIRLKNYFDPHSEDVINFSQAHKFFIKIDRERAEVKFYVAQGEGQEEINLVIVYEQRHNRFKTYSYADVITEHNSIYDIDTQKYIDLLGGYRKELDGTKTYYIFELTNDNNDYGQGIRWDLRTKAINIGTLAFGKAMKMIKVVGKYFTNINIFYTIDDDKRQGETIMRTTNKIHEAETMIYDGYAKSIIIEVSGESALRDPVRIDEILLGYETLKRMR